MPKLTEQERKVLEVKYKSPQIRYLTEPEFLNSSNLLLFRIHVITGWNFPTDEATVKVLRDEFQKLLQEQYGDLNTDEIEFAFRERSHTVEDWGKNMNLGLINRILKPYLYDRQEISNMEAGLKKEDNYAEIASLSWWRGQIEQSYQDYLNGVKKPYLHHCMLDILLKDELVDVGGYITEHDKKVTALKYIFIEYKKNDKNHIYVPDNG